MTLTIDDVIKPVEKTMRIRPHGELQVLLDTCSIKRIPYQEREGLLKADRARQYQVFITENVMNEVHRLRGIIPWQVKNNVYEMVDGVLSRDIIDVATHRYLIDVGESSHTKTRTIGHTDREMIGYALERAYQGKQTILVSDDAHILQTVSWFRKKHAKRKFYRSFIAACDMSRAVQNAYGMSRRNTYRIAA